MTEIIPPFLNLKNLTYLCSNCIYTLFFLIFIPKSKFSNIMKIEGTKSTPSVVIEQGFIEIKGRSIPEDSHDFFSPIITEIQTFAEALADKTEIRFRLEYINSGSKKYISTILGILNDMYLQGKDISILWHYDYDDESMLELGNDFRSLLEMPFKVIEVK